MLERIQRQMIYGVFFQRTLVNSIQWWMLGKKKKGFPVISVKSKDNILEFEQVLLLINKQTWIS